MTGKASEQTGWFEGLEPDDLEAAATAIRDGRSDVPREWSTLAIESGFVDDSRMYYDRLRDAAIRSTREQVQTLERAGDQQLKHAVRALDDCERTANELAERVTEWAGGLFEHVEPGIDGARDLAGNDSETAAERQVVSLANRVDHLADERDSLYTFIEETAPTVVPNLSVMAGPVLASRLIEQAGTLESLAKKSAGTLQVLGAEDALFAHLEGRAPSPKHGVIFAHEYVHGTRPEDRGSAARAFAAKLAIAARIDYYAGEYRPDVHETLRERMATIRARDEDNDSASLVGDHSGNDDE